MRWNYKGHDCDISQEYEDDNIKAWHTVKTPDGRTLTADISPYDTDPHTVELWIDAGYPERPDSGNWTHEELQLYSAQRDSGCTTFVVDLLAFGMDNERRKVEVPNTQLCGTDHDSDLSAVFYYGQNEVQPQNHPSLSMGDVIRLYGRNYLVQRGGFQSLTHEELASYKRLDRRDRHFSELVNPKSELV